MSTKLLQIQMPAGLRERLLQLADRDRRSMTAEALVLLETGIAERELQMESLADIRAGKTQISPELAERYR